MKRIFLPLLLFLFVILEGVALELLPPQYVLKDLFFIPHWGLVFLVMVAIFYDNEQTYFAVIYGAIFGMLIDVAYTGILGVYMFTYAVTLYVIHGCKKFLHANFHVTILLCVFGIAIADTAIYIIYSVINIAEMHWNEYLLYRFLPTILANVVFLLILYPIFKKRLIKWSSEQITNS